MDSSEPQRGSPSPSSDGPTSRFRELGDTIPRAGNWFTRSLGRIVFRIAGWKLDGFFPNEPKQILIVAPHTTWWDVPLAITIVWASGLRAHWIGKHTIFRKPFGGVMRWFGGIPVRRDSAQGLVGQIVAEFDRRAGFVLGIAPEGTRKSVTEWRSGFWHIAREANVPIVPVKIDNPRRRVIFGSPFRATGDYATELERVRLWYDRT